MEAWLGGWLGCGWGVWAGWAAWRPSGWGLCRWLEGVDLNVTVKGLPSGVGASGCGVQAERHPGWFLPLARVPRADSVGNMELDHSISSVRPHASSSLTV